MSGGAPCGLLRMAWRALYCSLSSPSPPQSHAHWHARTSWLAMAKARLWLALGVRARMMCVSLAEYQGSPLMTGCLLDNFSFPLFVVLPLAENPKRCSNFDAQSTTRPDF